jgi:hypothetical protein
MSKKDKTYVEKSTIENIGYGLFAMRDIKKGEIIVEFKGRLIRPGGIMRDERSNIYFNDGYILGCEKNDIASFANDCIDLPKKRRQFVSELEKDESFYKFHKNARLNAHIKLHEDNNNHRAFLVALTNIIKNEEIFVHYGFLYWFSSESSKGFAPEKQVEENGFPEKIHEYPGFVAYVKQCYPESIGFECLNFDGNLDFYTVIIKFESGSELGMKIPNCKKIFKRVEL